MGVVLHKVCAPESQGELRFADIAADNGLAQLDKGIVVASFSAEIEGHVVGLACSRNPVCFCQRSTQRLFSIDAPNAVLGCKLFFRALQSNRGGMISCIFSPN